jgi:hypothetical protein
MTRSSKLALVTLLVGLLSFTSVAAVNADPICIKVTDGQCAPVTEVDNAITYHIEATSPTHILAGNGMGQEHFEAMSAGTVSLFAVAAPSPATDSLPRFAPEHFEQIATVGADLSNADTNAAATTARYGQEHYEEIMAASIATN